MERSHTMNGIIYRNDFRIFELDVFQIMPNHIHGIIVLKEPNVPNVRAGFTSAPNENGANDLSIWATARVAPTDENGETISRAGVNPAHTNATVGNIVGAYKSLVANGCLDIFKQKHTTVRAGFTSAQPTKPAQPMPYMGKLWHCNYYEHIIRDEESYQTIANYIVNNPRNWKVDTFYSL